MEEEEEGWKMRKAITLLMICALVSGCASYSTMKYSGTDATLDKEGFAQKTSNDNVSVSARIRNNREISVVKLKVVNNSPNPISVTPADIRLVDADKFVIKMVSPDEAVRIAEGEVVPTTIVNSYQGGNYPNYSFNAYSQQTGNISGTIKPASSSGGGFAGSFAQSFNQAAAQSAAMAPYYRNVAIQNTINDAYKNAFGFSEIAPNTGIQGNVYFYTSQDQKMPFFLTVAIDGKESDFQFDK